MTLSVMNVGKLGIWPGDVPKMRITERRGEAEEGVEEGVEAEEEEEAGEEGILEINRLNLEIKEMVFLGVESGLWKIHLFSN